MITDRSKITVGARGYKVRAGRNLHEWEKIAGSLRYDRVAGEICANVYFVERQGVRRDFIQYAVRNDFLRLVNS
jgi:hypothetical protein